MSTWSRSDKIALLSLVVAMVACLAAIVVIPEVRQAFGLGASLEDQGPSSTKVQGEEPSGAANSDTAPPSELPNSEIFGTYQSYSGNGSLKISPAGNGKVEVKIYRAPENCVAEVEGVGEVSGNRIAFFTTDGEYPCSLEIIASQHKATVIEESCTGWHGAGCGFDDTFWK
jgi:hypothetical protein